MFSPVRTLGKALKAKAHCTLQTWSFKMAFLVKDWAKWKQFSTFNDWHRGPSFVQVHIVQGLTLLASPVWIVFPPTLQATRSFHNSRLISGRALHGTLGFKKGSGMSNLKFEKNRQIYNNSFLLSLSPYKTMKQTKSET